MAAQSQGTVAALRRILRTWAARSFVLPSTSLYWVYIHNILLPFIIVSNFEYPCMEELVAHVHRYMGYQPLHTCFLVLFVRMV